MLNLKTTPKQAALLVAVGAMLAAASGAAPETREQIEASPGERLEVDLQTGGGIQIEGWNRNLVEIEAEAYGSELEVKRTPSGIRVATDLAKLSGHRHDHDNKRWKQHCSGHSVKIRVPARFDIRVNSMGGGIKIAGVEGEIGGQTMGGNLELSQLKGVLALSTMGGSIELTDSKVDGKVETMGGPVLLKNVTGDIDGSSMGGNVVYKNVTRPDGTSTGQAVIITTMGGDVEVAEAWAGAKLRTMGGDIELGSAAKYVDAETMGGDIELGSVEGWVRAVTMGGDIEVRIVGDPQATDRHVTLESKGGDIELVVPRNFSADVEIELVYTKGRKDEYEIESDLPLEMSESEKWKYGRGAPYRMITARGTFAGGKNKVTIKTINGDVVLRQG